MSDSDYFHLVDQHRRVPKPAPGAHCGDPERCSVCLGAVPRKVELVGGEALVDGVPAADASNPYAVYGQRGAKATQRKYAVKPATRNR